MFLFVFCALVTLGAVALLIVPYLRPEAQKAEASDYNLTVYRDQLAELKRDVQRGLIAAEEEEAARLEIERRMLLEAKSGSSEKQKSSRPPLVLFACLGLTPVVAGMIYFMQGSPMQPAAPFAAREDLATAPAAADGMHAGMGDMVSTLQERLQETPEDAEGWALLARSLVNLNRYQDAIEAYREANRLVGGRDKQLAAEYAETLVIANEGIVSPEAKLIFEAFIAENANDPQAVYYLGLAKAQEGNVPEAISDWERLIENSPPDAPWLSVVERQLALVRDGDMSAATTERRTQPAATTPQPQATGTERRGPTAADIQAAQQLSSEQQGQMIEGMVADLAARLEENPDDLSGWRMLARSYSTLGRTEEARNAYEQILRLAPNDPDARAALGL